MVGSLFVVGAAIAKTMKEPLILYSTNAWLAWRVADDFYGGIHYVWCAPSFDGRQDPLRRLLPPTSSPMEIYLQMEEEISRGDRHSANVARIKSGIVNGATARLNQGLISDRERATIVSVVEQSDISDYQPLLFLIPYMGVKDILVEVPPEQKAHPMSREWRIENLPSDRFEVLRLGRL